MPQEDGEGSECSRLLAENTADTQMSGTWPIARGDRAARLAALQFAARRMLARGYAAAPGPPLTSVDTKVRKVPPAPPCVLSGDAGYGNRDLAMGR